MESATDARTRRTKHRTHVRHPREASASGRDRESTRPAAFESGEMATPPDEKGTAHPEQSGASSVK